MAKPTRRTFLAALLALPACLAGTKPARAAAPTPPPAVPVPPRLEVAEPDGSVTVFRYDAWHRLSSVQDSLGSVTTFTYDCTGKVVAELPPQRPQQPPAPPRA